MTLQRKTLSIVVMTFSALIAVLYIASQILLSQNVNNIDSYSTKQDLERAENALRTNLRTLEGTTRDWSLWTATYDFIADHNAAYIEENLGTASVMDDNQLSLMLFVDARANIVFVRAYDYREGEEVPLWPELAKQIYPGSPLLQHANADSSMTGVLDLSDSAILLASEPILTSEADGDIRGTLIFGRLLDDVALEQLGDKILSSVDICGATNRTCNFLPMTGADLEALAALAEGTSAYTLPISETSLAGYKVLNDIYGKPTFLLRVVVPRDAYEQSKDMLGLFVLMLIGVGLVFAVVVGLTIQHMVLSRLARLRTQVASITANQDVTTRVEASGSDELSSLADSINEMLSSLDHAQAAQEADEKRFHDTFEASPAAQMLTRQSDGEILDVNDAFVDLFGYSLAEVVGRTVAELNLWHDWEQRHPIRVELEERGSVRGKEIVFRAKSGELKTLIYSVQAIEIQGQLCLLSAGLDISAHKKAEELRTAKEVAEQTNNAKTEFLSRMSHELRTPLNAVLGFAQLLKISNPTEKQERHLDYIIKGGEHLLDLVNEVLDIARIDQGHLAINLESIDLESIVGQCIDVIHPLAEQHNIEVSTGGDLDPGSFAVMADHQRLTQVLINLLANAVKYNRPGGSVVVSTVTPEGKEGRIRVIVKDNGKGIPADKMHSLFHPFERLGAENSDVEGTGLGLALSKRLLEAMHGEIGVESVFGQGSTFWIELPATRIESSGPADGNASKAGKVTGEDRFGKSRTVLYIEDNLSNLRLVEAILNNTDLTLMAAMQGRIGLDLSKQNHPDLIILDLNLPDINGEEVLRLLREDPATAAIPVIILSADAIPGRVKRLLSAGAQGYLTKPLDVALFLKTLTECLEPESVGEPEPELERMAATAMRRSG